MAKVPSKSVFTLSTLTDNIEALRQSFRKVKGSRPFSIEAMIVLPDPCRQWGEDRKAGLPEGNEVFGGE